VTRVCFTACVGRKQEVIKLTEQLLTAIAMSDFESYTYVDFYVCTLKH